MKIINISILALLLASIIYGGHALFVEYRRYDACLAAENIFLEAKESWDSAYKKNNGSDYLIELHKATISLRKAYDDVHLRCARGEAE
jgi:hypothetical protein